MLFESTEPPSRPLPCVRKMMVDSTAYREGRLQDDVDGEEFLCTPCNSQVTLIAGTVEAPDCGISGQCEKFWLEKYPDEYRQDKKATTPDVLNCANCAGYFALSYECGEVATVESYGRCRIDVAGEDFHTKGLGTDLLNYTVPHDISVIPPFDGEGGVASRTITAKDLPTVDIETKQGLYRTACVGKLLASQVEIGTPPADGVYRCPLSVESGEHCMQTLRLRNGVIGRDDSANWNDNDNCLENRSQQ